MDRSKRFTLFSPPPPPPPGKPVHSDTNSASPGSILAMLQLRAKTKSLTFPPLFIARYSFIQLSQLEHQWRERKCPIFETVAKGGFEPGVSSLRVRHSTTELPRFSLYLHDFKVNYTYSCVMRNGSETPHRLYLSGAVSSLIRSAHHSAHPCTVWNCFL